MTGEQGLAKLILSEEEMVESSFSMNSSEPMRRETENQEGGLNINTEQSKEPEEKYPEKEHIDVSHGSH